MERTTAERAVATLGLRRDVDPQDALLEVHRTAGHVAWLSQIVSTLDRDDVTRGIAKVVELPDGGRRTQIEASINVWVQLYQDEREHLRRVCDTAIRAGVEEYHVRVQEQTAHELVDRIRLVLGDLGIDPDDEQVRSVVRLRLVEGVR